MPTIGNYGPRNIGRRLSHAAIQIPWVFEMTCRVSSRLHAIVVARLEMIVRILQVCISSDASNMVTVSQASTCHSTWQ